MSKDLIKYGLLSLLLIPLLLGSCGAQSPQVHSGVEQTGTTGTTATTDAATIPPYSRSDWGGWIDADHDCQDTRQEVLISESLVSVTFTDDRQCRVATGQWKDPYTDQVFTNPSDLDIDHVVALKEAHYAGGWAWDSDRKHAYANNLDNPDQLIAVSASANRSKGSRGPDEWLPPATEFVCQYLKIRRNIYELNQLSYDCSLYTNLLMKYCK